VGGGKIRMTGGQASKKLDGDGGQELGRDQKKAGLQIRIFFTCSRFRVFSQDPDPMLSSQIKYLHTFFSGKKKINIKISEEI